MLGRIRRRFGRPTRVLDPGEYPAEYLQAAANHFYFGHHKCATNWMRAFLLGLCRELRMNYLIYRGDNRGNVFSRRNAATFHLYVNSWPADLRKLGAGDRGFHLIRDPRDALVSTYFSWKFSHRVSDPRQRALREALEGMPFEEGLLFALERFYYGDEVARWELGSDPRVLDVRYEDLVASELAVFRRILDHLGLAIADARLAALVEACSFPALARRARGREDVRSHYRKGVAGDWKNYFGEDGPLKRAVHEKLEPLLLRLGYAP